MGCTCSIDAADCGAEAFDRYSRKMKTARRVFKCGECGSEISKGAEYEFAVGIYDGDRYPYRTCLLCVEIRECFFCSWLHKSMWQDLQVEIDEEPDEFGYGALDEISKPARDLFFEKIEIPEWDEED